MSKNFISGWKSLSPETLPLSLSGITVGSMLAAADYHVSLPVVLFVLLTAVSLHCFMASGSKVTLVPSVLFAVLSVYLSFGKILLLESLLMLLFTYFIMRLACGIVGSGRSRIADGLVMCFLTGPVAVMGTYYICSHSFGTVMLLLPALSVGAMNISLFGTYDGYGKKTLAALVVSGYVLMTVYALMRMFDPWHYLYLLSLPLSALFLVHVWKGRGQNVLPALSVMIFAVLSGLGFMAFLF